ncbi:hypothetical protein ES703_22606 [subsurface metagenome]
MIIVLPLAVKGIAAGFLPDKGKNKDNQDIPSARLGIDGNGNYQVAGLLKLPLESVSVDGNCELARTFVLIEWIQ